MTQEQENVNKHLLKKPVTLEPADRVRIQESVVAMLSPMDLCGDISRGLGEN